MGATSINIYTQIGLVTLIGLISKHGILMVDFANRLQERDGLSRRAAIEEAAAVRLRPILMTTWAMIVGMTPLIFAVGAGARSRFDIGLTIFAGMSIGTLFTLFVTPAVYTFHRARSRGGDGEARRAGAPRPAAAARRAAAGGQSGGVGGRCPLRSRRLRVTSVFLDDRGIATEPTVDFDGASRPWP